MTSIMNITVDDLQVLSSGSVVIKKDSVVKFEVDDSHSLIMQFMYNEDKDVHIDVEQIENGLVFKCFNFGVNGSSRGLKFPVKVMDVEGGGHLLFQFIVMGVGEARTLNYTWYKDDSSSENQTTEKEV